MTKTTLANLWKLDLETLKALATLVEKLAQPRANAGRSTRRSAVAS